MSKKLVKEPYIVCIDDLEGNFELIHWAHNEKEANRIYDEWDENYPDREGRNKHVFKMIRTTGQDLGDTET